MGSGCLKKRQGVWNGRGHATRLSNPQTEGEASGAKGDLGNSKSFLFKASSSQKAVSREGSLHYTPKGQMEALGSGACDRFDRSVQLEEPVNKGSKTSYLPRDKKGTNAKGKRILKRASLDSASQQSLRSPLPFSDSSATQTHGADWLNPSSSSTLGLGNLVQGQSDSHPRLTDRVD